MVVKTKAFQMLSIWMNESGVRQVDLAEKLGVTRSAVNRWCKGLVVPQKEHTQKIAKISEGRVPDDIWVRVETTSPAPGPQKLREVVNECAISVSKLARICDLDQGTMARYIDGRSQNIRACQLSKINEALGLKLKPQDFVVQA